MLISTSASIHSLYTSEFYGIERFGKVYLVKLNVTKGHRALNLSELDSLKKGCINQIECKVPQTINYVDSIYQVFFKFPYPTTGPSYENEPLCTSYFSYTKYKIGDKLFIYGHKDCWFEASLEASVTGNSKWVYERYKIALERNTMSISMEEYISTNLDWIMRSKSAQKDNEYSKWLRLFLKK